AARHDFMSLYQLLVTPKSSALILAMTLAASDSTRTTRTPRSALSTSRIAVAMASCSDEAVRLNSREATPSRRFNSMSPPVAAYKASASSGVSSATPERIRVKVCVFMVLLPRLSGADNDSQIDESPWHGSLGFSALPKQTCC